MAVTAATFRQHLPEFANGKRFPDAVIDYGLSIAVKLVNSSRWGTLTDHGVEQMTAHFLTLERRAMDEAQNGASPGMASGMINSKSVDKVSIGYDTSSTMASDASHWNLTIYGLRYIRLARLMGKGPIQVGAGWCGPPNSGPAWAGPWPWNFPNPVE